MQRFFARPNDPRRQRATVVPVVMSLLSFSRLSLLPLTWGISAHSWQQRKFRSFYRGAAGAAASEYAVLIAMLIVAVLVSVNILGASVTGSFTNIEGNLAAVAAGGGGGDDSAGDKDRGGKGKGKSGDKGGGGD